MKGRTPHQLQDDVRSISRKWESADAAVHQSRLVLEAAQGKYRNGDEADASILIDAAKVILDAYVSEP